jgi:hypothetical protein
MFSQEKFLAANRETKVYLKQLNFLMMSCMCKPVSRRYWICTICEIVDRNDLTKREAIEHVRNRHGHMIEENSSRDSQIKTLLDMREMHKNLKNRMVHPCYQTTCDQYFNHASENFFHLRTDHTSNTPELLCFSCQHPLGEENLECHWAKRHISMRCKEPECNKVTLSQLHLYISHLNLYHINQITDSLTYGTLERLYRKIREQEYSIIGMHMTRAMFFSRNWNSHYGFFPYDKAFRRLYEHAPEGDNTFITLVVENIDDEKFDEFHLQPIPRMLRKLNVEINQNTIVEECHNYEPMVQEVHWLRQDLPNTPTSLGDHAPFCVKCQDSECHMERLDCVSRMVMQSHSANIIQHAMQTIMSMFAATLIGVKEKMWGNTPYMDRYKIYNISDQRTGVTYATGSMGRVPIHFKRGEVSVLSTVDYFSHCRLMLECLRGNLVEPVFLEFFESHDTNCKEEMTSMVRGYLDGVQQLQNEYNYCFMILAPVSRTDHTTDLPGYLNALHRTKQITRILMAHVSVFNFGIVPTEGYLYSIPVNSYFNKWRTYDGPNADKILRNRDGSVTTAYLRRAGRLISVAIEEFRTARRDYTRRFPHLGRHDITTLETG